MADVCVLGLGRIGLPLALLLAKARAEVNAGASIRAGEKDINLLNLSIARATVRQLKRGNILKRRAIR